MSLLGPIGARTPSSDGLFSYYRWKAQQGAFVPNQDHLHTLSCQEDRLKEIFSVMSQTMDFLQR